VLVGGEEGGRVTGGFGRSLRAPLGEPLEVAAAPRGGQASRWPTNRVRPSIDRTYPLAEVPEAMRHLQAGNARGKVAITI
jgi:NADPH:quinone reductase-like Zn-dependent oxidoreductase